MTRVHTIRLNDYTLTLHVEAEGEATVAVEGPDERVAADVAARFGAVLNDPVGLRVFLAYATTDLPDVQRQAEVELVALLGVPAARAGGG